MRKFTLYFAAVMNLLLLDQFVKAAAVFHLKGHSPVVVVKGFFDLAYVENRGCAWGMFQGHVWPLALFAIVAMAVLVWKRNEVFSRNWLGRVTEVMLYAGILGNLVDRLYLGYVVDFLDFHWYAHHFPCFNIADSYITISAALLLIVGFRKEK